MLGAGFQNYAQKIPEFEKSIFIDSAGNTYVNKKMPVYISIVTDSQPDTNHTIPSPSEHANPMYFDSHGKQYMVHLDPETGKKTRYKIFADGQPPESELNLKKGLKLQFEERFYCEELVIIEIHANDNNSGAKKSFYSIDGEEYIKYKDPVVVKKEEKIEKISFFSIDNVGNVEKPNIANFIFDLDNVIDLENIYFALDSDRLNADAQEQLDELANSLKNFPEISIELRSHTDVRGSSDYNKLLSERRAQSTKRYLMSKGISADRLEAKGFGDTKIINHCLEGVECTEEEHRENRRTEFRIIPFEEK